MSQYNTAPSRSAYSVRLSDFLTWPVSRRVRFLKQEFATVPAFLQPGLLRS